MFTPCALEKNVMALCRFEEDLSQLSKDWAHLFRVHYKLACLISSKTTSDVRPTCKSWRAHTCLVFLCCKATCLGLRCTLWLMKRPKLLRGCACGEKEVACVLLHNRLGLLLAWCLSSFGVGSEVAFLDASRMPT